MSKIACNKPVQNANVIYEKDRNNGTLFSKILIIPTERKKKNKLLVRVQQWKLVIASIFVACLITVLIGAIVLKSNDKPPAQHKENCLMRSCNTQMGLKCVNGACDCQKDEYFDRKCLPKKNYGEYCQDSMSQCKSEFICFNGLCSCNRTKTWTGLRCENFSMFGDDCNRKACDTKKALVCDQDAKFCTCNSSRFWTGETCALKKSIYDKCTVTSDCIEEKSLLCINGSCLCDNSIKYYGNLELECLDKKFVGYSCLLTLECFSNLVCNGTNCECLNSLTHYFNETQMLCVDKTLNNIECSLSLSCRNDLGLSCVSARCQCNTNLFFWNGTACQQRQIRGPPCGTTAECQDYNGLSCRNSRCICDMHQYWNTTFGRCVDLPPCYINRTTMFSCVTTESLSWDDANTWCKQYDGNIFGASVASEEGILNSTHTLINSTFWIGARAYVGLNFVWVYNNQTVNPSLWCPGEPNGGAVSEPCAVAGWNAACPKLNDLNCGNSNRFLCEKR